MRTVKLTIAFDGTGLAGWQSQRNGQGIQDLIEARLAKMIGTPVRLHGAGRTDAGVHALAMAAHFQTESAIPLAAFVKGLNSLLPRAIRILDAQEAAPDFHARFSALGKAYRYQFVTSPILLPLDRLYFAHFPGPFDPAPVSACLDCLLGEHDFSSFEATGSRDQSRTEGRGAVRRISRAVCLTIDAGRLAWAIEIEGDGFLRHMVRNIVGTVVEAGRGRLAPERFRAILEARDRTQAGPTAPAQGLHLVRVLYG